MIPTTPRPTVSVILCTRDRVTALQRSLPAILEAARTATLSVEILVVDNASLDTTAAYLSEMATAHPLLLRVLSCPTPGQARARNLAIAGSRGDVLLFTDDDVHVPPSWIMDLAEPILNNAADGVSGRVQLAPSLQRPWMSPMLRATLAEALDFNPASPWWVGASMALSAPLARFFEFDEALGPGALGGGDDVLLNYRLQATGHRIVASAGPPAVHYPDEHRLNHSAMVAHARRNGRSGAYIWHHWLHTPNRFTRARLLIIRAQLAMIGIRRRRAGPGISEREFTLNYRLELYRGLLQLRRTPRRYPTPST